MTQASTPTGTDCTVAPTSTTIGGPAPYWTSYTVDPATGNRTSVTQNPTSGTGTTATDTYAYPTAGAANPHAVQQVTHSATSSTDTYGYDPAGDTTTRPGQTLTYDDTGKLSTVTTGGVTQSNIYDASGTLLMQSDPTTGTTLFMGDTELHIADSYSASNPITLADPTGLDPAMHQRDNASPNNLRAIRVGNRQIEGYLTKLNEQFPGEPWTGSVVTYGP